MADKELKFTIMLKSKHCEAVHFIECSDWDYKRNEKNELTLLSYNTKSVHLGKTDVTEICRITDGVMQITNVEETDVEILHG